MDKPKVKTLSNEKDEINQLIIDSVLKNKLDRRKIYSESMGYLATVEKATYECSGCTEYGDYGTRYGPYGCRECGYTGKRVGYFPEPVTLNGKIIQIINGGEADAHRPTNPG